MKKDVFARARASNEALARRGAEGIRAAIGTEEKGATAPTIEPHASDGHAIAHAPIAPAEGGALQVLRPENLKGMEGVNVWLRARADEILAEPIGEKTAEQYERNGERLHLARVPGQPVDLSGYSGSTFYTYRAAVQRHAAKRGKEAAAAYDRAKKAENKARKSGDEAAAAKHNMEARTQWQVLLYVASDLVAYPREPRANYGAQPAAVASADLKVKPKKKEAGKASNAKLKASNGIARKFPEWRPLVWNQLVKVRSPWVDCAAVSALTGARPDEVLRAHWRRVGNEIEIGIDGAKVSNVKGQPWRWFKLRDDGSAEFAHALAHAPEEKWTEVRTGKGTPNAYSMALAGAGKQVLPGAPRMSAYVYRHSIASDMKADGMSMEQIAQALGHAVTKTQDAYGRAIGGKAGRRSFSVDAAREVRATHDARYRSEPTQTVEIPAPQSIETVPFVIETTPIFEPSPWGEMGPT